MMLREFEMVIPLLANQGFTPMLGYVGISIVVLNRQHRYLERESKHHVLKYLIIQSDISLSNVSAHGVGTLKIHVHPDCDLVFCCCTVPNSSSITNDAMFGVINGYATTTPMF